MAGLPRMPTARQVSNRIPTVRWAANLKDFNSKLDGKIYKADKKAADGLKRATEYVKTGAGKRTFPTGARNVQDTTNRPDGRTGRASIGKQARRTPVRSRFDSNKKAGIVSIKPYWANIRSSHSKLSPVIVKMMRRFYSVDDLYRTNLKVLLADDEGRKIRPGKRTLKKLGFRKIFKTKQFKTHPRLVTWAQRVDKGYQFARHIMEMPAELRKALSLQPSVDDNLPKIRREVATSVIEGLTR